MDQLFKISSDHNSGQGEPFSGLIVPKYYLELTWVFTIDSALMAFMASYNLGKEVIFGLFFAFFEDFNGGFLFK